MELAKEMMEDEKKKKNIDYHFLITTRKDQTYTHFFPLVRKEIIIRKKYNKNKKKIIPIS